MQNSSKNTNNPDNLNAIDNLQSEQDKKRERVLLRQKLLKDNCYRKYNQLTRSESSREYISSFDQIKPRRVRHTPRKLDAEPRASQISNPTASVADASPDINTVNTSLSKTPTSLPSTPSNAKSNLATKKASIAIKTNGKHGTLNSETQKSSTPFVNLDGFEDYLTQLEVTATPNETTSNSMTHSSFAQKSTPSKQENLSLEQNNHKHIFREQNDTNTKADVIPWILSFLIIGLLLVQSALLGMLYLSSNISLPETYLYISSSVLTLSLLTIFRILHSKHKLFTYLGLSLTLVAYVAFTTLTILRILNRI